MAMSSTRMVELKRLVYLPHSEVRGLAPWGPELVNMAYVARVVEEKGRVQGCSVEQTLLKLVMSDGSTGVYLGTLEDLKAQLEEVTNEMAAG